MKLGIIGIGRLGRLIYDLARGEMASYVSEVLAYDRDPKEGVTLVSLAEVCDVDLLVVCVPISTFEGVIQEIASLVPAGTIVVDVCSVKEHPVAVMLKYLPENVQVCATHPIFGPDSVRANGGLAGLPMVVCPARLSLENDRMMLQLFDKLKLDVQVMSAAEHDRQIARSLLYTHLIGRIGERIGLQSTGIDTKGFTQLLQVQGYVVNDSWELFVDMNNYNNYAQEMRDEVKQALEGIEEEIHIKIPDQVRE